MVTSVISTNSSSHTFFATLGASIAAGLNGPYLLRPKSPAFMQTVGLSPDGWRGWGVNAAAASRYNPVCVPDEGVNVDSPARVLARESRNLQEKHNSQLCAAISFLVMVRDKR